MIKNRRIIISIGFIAVLIIYLLQSKIQWKSGDIPAVKKFDSIDEILITKQDKQIKIDNKDSKWFINGEYPADALEVNKLEEDMKNLEITDYISKGQYYLKYDLTPDKAIKVTMKKSGSIKREIFIGKASSTSKNTYIKFADNDKVFLANGNLYSEFNKEVNDLRDKQIYKIARSDLEWLELNYQGARLTFEKVIEQQPVPEKNKKEDKKDTKDKNKQTAEKWICKEFKNINLDDNKVNSFADAFSSIKADSYPDIKKKDIQGIICKIRGKAYGKEIELTINKKEKEEYLSTSSESPYVFMIKEWEAKRFFKTLNDFKTDIPKEKKNNK